MAYIKLDKKSYFHNLETLTKLAGGTSNIAVVLKDNAYGHGLLEMAELAVEFGITKAVVKNEKEANKICSLFDLILILMPDFTLCDNLNFSYTINSLDQLMSAKSGMKIHLKIDTGMNRNGICESEIENALKLISKNSLILEGVMTHFACADELGDDFFTQLDRWKMVKQRVLDQIKDLNIQRPYFHSFASSALLRSDMIDDFARCGIATYGYTQLDRDIARVDLKPVLTLVGQKLSTKLLKRGDRVGYGGVGVVLKDCKVSTYDIGYGDGFFRYDGKDKLFIDNKRVVGRVSMDSISLEGDCKEVKIIDDALKLSKFFNTISYDILVKISQDIKRVVV